MTAAEAREYGDVRMPERYWTKVYPEPNTGCWLWGAAVRADGYGAAWSAEQRRMRLAHRASWEDLVGPVPAGLELDHLCRVRSCVNPLHLEPVTRSINIRRGVGPETCRVAFRKTHCKYGHEFDDENTFVQPGTGHWKCRACGRRKYHERKARTAGTPRRQTPRPVVDCRGCGRRMPNTAKGLCGACYQRGRRTLAPAPATNGAAQ